MEVWRDIPGMPHYQASNLGRVKSKRRIILYKDGRNFNYEERILRKTPLTKRGGHYTISISHNGVRKTHYVHKLVYSAFYGEVEDGLVIDHIDNNPQNNRINNLQAVTIRENNSKDQWRHKDNSMPVGVSPENGRYKARIHTQGTMKHLGMFDNPNDAHERYLQEVKKIENEGSF